MTEPHLLKRILRSISLCPHGEHCATCNEWIRTIVAEHERLIQKNSSLIADGERIDWLEKQTFEARELRHVCEMFFPKDKTLRQAIDERRKQS